MNEYIIPICNIPESKVYIEKIIAKSISDCQDKLMDKYNEYSGALDYQEFLDDLDSQDILIGTITELDEL